MKYKLTTTEISVHLETENPIFGENAFHVCIDDEAAGPIVCIKQIADDEESAKWKMSHRDMTQLHAAQAQTVRSFLKSAAW